MNQQEEHGYATRVSPPPLLPKATGGRLAATRWKEKAAGTCTPEALIDSVGLKFFKPDLNGSGRERERETMVGYFRAKVAKRVGHLAFHMLIYGNGI